MKEISGPIFTLEEVAAYLKVGKRTVYRLVSEGRIPAFKIGGTWRFRQTELDQWIAKRMSNEAHEPLDRHVKR